VEGARIRFVGDIPPKEYTAGIIVDIIYNEIFGWSSTEEIKYITLDDLYQHFPSYYPPVVYPEKWKKYASPQVKKESVKESCELLDKIKSNLSILSESRIKELNLSPNKLWLEVKNKKPPKGKGGIYDWICKKIYETRKKEEEKKLKAEEREKARREEKLKKS
jgi:hypothetical protein